MIARASDFQASWYFSLLALAILGLLVGGAVSTALGIRRLWRNGERAPAAVLALATAVGVMMILGMYAMALGGVIANGGHGGGG